MPRRIGFWPTARAIVVCAVSFHSVIVCLCVCVCAFVCVHSGVFSCTWILPDIKYYSSHWKPKACLLDGSTNGKHRCQMVRKSYARPDCFTQPFVSGKLLWASFVAAGSRRNQPASKVTPTLRWSRRNWGSFNRQNRSNWRGTVILLIN